MDPLKTGHEKPVDCLAVRLLMRAPWWAQYPEPAKFAVREVTAQHSWEAWIDYTKAPPRRCMGGDSEIKDRRGVKIYWSDGKVGTVIGYADARRLDKPGRRRIGAGGVHVHAWWVAVNGEVWRVPWLDRFKRAWLSEEDLASGTLCAWKQRKFARVLESLALGREVAKR